MQALYRETHFRIKADVCRTISKAPKNLPTSLLGVALVGVVALQALPAPDHLVVLGGQGEVGVATTVAVIAMVVSVLMVGHRPAPESRSGFCSLRNGTHCAKEVHDAQL